MRPVSFAGILACTLLCWNPAHAANQYSVTIGLADDSGSGDAPPNVKVTFIGTGKSPILIPFSGDGASDFMVTVLDDAGHMVPKTPLGSFRSLEADEKTTNMVDPNHNLGLSFSVQRHQLLPGETYSEQINLSNLYKLPPGKYSVSATYRFDTDEARKTGRSNEVTFLVN